MKLQWDCSDDECHTAKAGNVKFCAWRDGALSGTGPTTYHETRAAAKQRAEYLAMNT